jgi:hypothetical protein
LRRRPKAVLVRMRVSGTLWGSGRSWNAAHNSAAVAATPATPS